MARKTYPLRPTVKLWGAMRVVAGLFMVFALLMSISFARSAVMLAGLPGETAMVEDDLYMSADALGLLLMAAGIPYFIVYVVGAFLVLRWYLRSLRNAGRLHAGFPTSPGWAVWGFIIPIVSLVKPYGMTSELWRSSSNPDKWRGLKDPVLLRWWWGLVLVGGFGASIGDLYIRYAQTVSQIQIGSSLSSVMFLVQIAAGVLFLGVTGPISRRQTALIEAGHESAPAPGPPWSS